MRRLFKALWTYSLGQRAIYCVAMLLLMGAELLRLSHPYLAGEALNALQFPDRGGIPAAARDLGLIVGTSVLAWVLHGPARILERNVAIRVREAYAAVLADRLMRAPLSWHSTHPSADASHRAQQSANALHQFAEKQYLYLQNLVMLVGPLVALAALSLRVALVAAAGIVIIITAGVRFDLAIGRLTDQYNKLERSLNTAWLDTTGGILSIKALRLGPVMKARILNRMRGLNKPLKTMVVVNESKWAFVDLASIVLSCGLVVIYVLEQRSLHGVPGLAVGNLYMVYEYARRSDSVLATIAADFSTIASHGADFASALPITTAPTDPDDRLRSSEPWSELVLRDLAIGFADGQVRSLLPGGSTLRIKSGLKYAMVGPSGVGKSTLFRLLAGLDPSIRGIVELDGVPIGREHLRSLVTLLPQDAHFFDGSLAENLPGFDLQVTRVAELMASSGLDQTSWRERSVHLDASGGSLSGGEKRRVALARGLIAGADSQILLLDEPTSNLDLESELAVVKAILAALDRKTVVFTTHRSDFLDLFDDVIHFG